MHSFRTPYRQPSIRFNMGGRIIVRADPVLAVNLIFPKTHMMPTTIYPAVDGELIEDKIYRTDIVEDLPPNDDRFSNNISISLGGNIQKVTRNGSKKVFDYNMPPSSIISNDSILENEDGLTPSGTTNKNLAIINKRLDIVCHCKHEIKEDDE